MKAFWAAKKKAAAKPQLKAASNPRRPPEQDNGQDGKSLRADW
jgi:hypothetical protein